MFLSIESGRELSPKELNDLYKEFKKWLKSEKKISNYPNAKDDRKKIVKELENIVKEVGKSPTLKRVYDMLNIKKEEAPTDELTDELKYIEDFFRDRVGWLELEETTEKEPSPSSSKDNIIGRVAPTIHTPATPTEFTFWVKDEDNIHIEVGDLVTTIGSNDVKITGLVSELQSTSDVEGVLDSFYAHAFGRPEEDMPTKLPLIMSAKVEVVKRSDGRTEPVRGSWPVRFATAKEIREAYCAEIDHPILAGFTYDDQKQPIPIDIDANYLIGYEAAHMNISGASGLATKTSYALFLLYSLLAYGAEHKKDKETIAAIAFNVKEADLMFIDELPKKWEYFEIGINYPKLGPSIRLWKEAKENYKIDPLKWIKEKKFKFFAPMHFHPQGGVLSQRREVITPFNYSLTTLISTGVGSLYTLFDPADLDDKALALIAAIAEEAREKKLTFEKLIEELRNKLNDKRSGEWFTFGKTKHHKATGNKILNRMNHAIKNQLKGIILESENSDQPIPLDELKPGELWIVDLTQLSDKGQRLVFQTIVRTVFKKLEERKSLMLTNKRQENLEKFPKHVVIFVDELNKFVPAGREHSALKGEIVEMAARGRSVGLALIGAQQLASKVDEEVLANTSTFAVGRSHAVEIRTPPYAWLSRGLKERAMVLDKGWMLLWHSLHKRPVLIRFPLPLHKIYEEIEKMKKR